MQPDQDLEPRTFVQPLRPDELIRGGAESTKRSVAKALTYRVFIVCLDFLAIYILTHKVELALGFMVVSNIYTTVGYFAHERIWARIKWGRVAETASSPGHVRRARSARV